MINTPFLIWYAFVGFIVGRRSYSHARCGEVEAVFSGAFWPIWLVGMIFRTGEESVGFRWPDKDSEADIAEQSHTSQPEQMLTFASPDQVMTYADKSRFLVDLSKLDLKYGDARDIYDLLTEKVKAGSG